MQSHRQLNIVPKAGRAPTIVLTGGGSGGHITPLLSVAAELNKIKPDVKLVFIGQTGDKLQDIPKKHKSINSVYTIRAGKFRRYHGEGFRQLLDVKTLLKNIGDFFWFIIGFWQSFNLLGKIRPSIIFIKGGFVGVPVGLAAALRRIPYVTHDSDALPGLANRIISRWATAHAVALPKEVYNYPASKTFAVGVPISNKFHEVTDEEQARFKRELGFSKTSQIIFVTGGGLGAKRLNDLVLNMAEPLLGANQDLAIIHVAGRDHEKEVKSSYDALLKSNKSRSQVLVKGFLIDDLYKHSGAADIIICRAGATNLAEFAAQHKACIIVPNPYLTGGHQLKNASYLSKQKAAVVVDENELDKKPEKLIGEVQSLLNNQIKRKQLGARLGRFAKPRATKELAEILIENMT